MGVRTWTDEELRRIGSLKWTGITTTEGEPTIGAWVAEMDFGTAPEVADAMKNAIDDGLLGYRPTWLEPRAAAATACFQKRRFGWEVDPDHVRLVDSVLPALRVTISHLIAEDAPVVVLTPAYMPFLTIPGALGHEVVEVPSLHGEAAGGHGWALDLDGIDAALTAAPSPALVILCNPWNPTGRVLTREEMLALAEVVERHGALVFSDEIHSPLVLDDLPFLSYARLDDRTAAHTVTATAASKGWNIAGLPSAQVILPDAALRARWDDMSRTLHWQPSTIGTLGTIAAYESESTWQDEVRALIRGNVDRVEAALAGTGVDFTRPEGTYLTWWGFEGVELGAGSPATVLREKARIGVNEGSTLGTGWERWARVNLACAPAVVDTILERVDALLPR